MCVLNIEKKNSGFCNSEICICAHECICTSMCVGRPEELVQKKGLDLLELQLLAVGNCSTKVQIW